MSSPPNSPNPDYHPQWRQRLAGQPPGDLGMVTPWEKNSQVPTHRLRIAEEKKLEMPSSTCLFVQQEKTKTILGGFSKYLKISQTCNMWDPMGSPFRHDSPWVSGPKTHGHPWLGLSKLHPEEWKGTGLGGLKSCQFLNVKLVDVIWSHSIRKIRTYPANCWI